MIAWFARDLTSVPRGASGFSVAVPILFDRFSIIKHNNTKENPNLEPLNLMKFNVIYDEKK